MKTNRSNKKRRKEGRKESEKENIVKDVKLRRYESSS